MIRRDLYGICKDGLVLRARDHRFGTTGILRWRALFSRLARAILRAQMAGALAQMHAQATAPSKNQMKRMRQRGQA